ncbi:flavin monoamine oxidase family protein [Microbulbifer agarilyticus]|uniref:flavin monoamine oxidase family protein n=1 Tax=Microbulbifer agarilyticus TaxID=260552 RepID=UPI001CD2EFC5|nr:NAD(P)/FAD-dependent oxidoreductase [Microbulbifer agarilyticus]MCA0899542.1 FAD-dependent oxidoreductase [Microbulbifer agarilyticus]
MSKKLISSRKDSGLGQKNRREFLKATGILAVSGTVSASQIKEAPQDKKSCTPGCDYDVVIIGGGFAGVTASRDCVENGYKTLLLEARNRLGGRTFSSELDGNQIELGGAWIHHSQPFVWAEKERYSMEVDETPGAMPDYMITIENGKQKILNAEEVGVVLEAFQRYLSDSRTVIPRPYELMFNGELAIAADKQSARTRLDEFDFPKYAYDMIDGYLGAAGGSTPDNMSYLEALRCTELSGGSFTTYMDAGGRFKLRDGTQALIENMLNDARPEIRLSTPVKEIVDLTSQVRVTTARGESVTAAAVIVALPMNVLPSLDFSPPLDSKLLQATKEGHAGKGYKQYIKVRGNHGNLFGAASSKNPYSVIGTFQEGDGYTIIVAFGADTTFDPYDDRAVQSALSAFIPDVEVISSTFYDWQLDPYSKGTYCNYAPKWMTKYDEVFARDNGRILFAQGDHGEGWRGYIDGAIGAGLKSAQRVKNLIG